MCNKLKILVNCHLHNMTLFLFRARDLAPTSIRALYGISDTRNATHGSGMHLLLSPTTRYNSDQRSLINPPLILHIGLIPKWITKDITAGFVNFQSLSQALSPLPLFSREPGIKVGNLNFYNNCPISRALISSFLLSVRVQTDKSWKTETCTRYTMQMSYLYASDLPFKNFIYSRHLIDIVFYASALLWKINKL